MASTVLEYKIPNRDSLFTVLLAIILSSNFQITPIILLQHITTMRVNAFYALAALPTLGWAFPQMAGVASRKEMLEQLKQQRDEELVAEKRSPEPEPQLLGAVGGIVGSLTSDITGLLGSVASAVNPNNKRPEAGYTFQAPGPNDSRGPCPGLNLLANYGYLPRNGYVNLGQVIDATA